MKIYFYIVDNRQYAFVLRVCSARLLNIKPWPTGMYDTVYRFQAQTTWLGIDD